MVSSSLTPSLVWRVKKRCSRHSEVFSTGKCKRTWALSQINLMQAQMVENNITNMSSVSRCASFKVPSRYHVPTLKVLGGPCYRSWDKGGPCYHLIAQTFNLFSCLTAFECHVCCMLLRAVLVVSFFFFLTKVGGLLC